jgi:hypothetical protein
MSWKGQRYEGLSNLARRACSGPVLPVVRIESSFQNKSCGSSSFEPGWGESLEGRWRRTRALNCTDFFSSGRKIRPDVKVLRALPGVLQIGRFPWLKLEIAL